MLRSCQNMIGDTGMSILEAHMIIQKNFIGEFDKSSYLDTTLTAMVESLGDRWSYYLNKDNYSMLQTAHTNSYKGIGIQVAYDNDAGLQILNIYSDSPADVAGIIAGDILVAVNGQKVTEDNYNDLVNSIGTTEAVTLSIQKSDETVRDVHLTPRTIIQDPVKSEMLEGNIGLVTISNFYENSARGFKTHVDALIDARATALIIDVRDNPGGYITELIEILDYLLPEGTICTCATRTGESTIYTSDAACVNLPMVVIVNEASYSAAEFLAAELQEAGGALLTGAPTAGKGFAQTTFDLKNGDAIGLSTFRYYTGKGVSLIDKGVTLDKEELEPDKQLQSAITILQEKEE